MCGPQGVEQMNKSKIGYLSDTRGARTEFLELAPFGIFYIASLNT